MLKRFILAGFAALSLLTADIAKAQQTAANGDIKTTDLGHNAYMLQGRGGDITVVVGSDDIILVDAEFAELHDKVMAAIRKISSLPIRYVINTHFHVDHTDGNALFRAEGATIVAQDNVRVRLAAGTVNGLTGAKTPPAAAAGIPTEIYIGGTKTVEVGGRRALLTHANNAHTDSDTWVYLADANILITGDIFTTNGHYPNIDFANGGDIEGMIRANDAFLKRANDSTRIVPGHGGVATKAQVAAFRDMLVTARDRMRKLIADGKSEQEVIAVKPFADFDVKLAPNEQASVNFIRVVYNSFKRS